MMTRTQMLSEKLFTVEQSLKEQNYTILVSVERSEHIPSVMVTSGVTSDGQIVLVFS